MADLQVDTASTGDDDAAASTTDGGGPSRRSSKREGRAFWAELPFLVLIALVLAIVLKTFVIQAFYIPSSSMEPTLQVQDRVLVTKLAYLYRDPRRGEVVVFSDQSDETVGQGEEAILARVLGSLASGLGFGAGDERDFIKRIIGLPGDVVEMHAGVVSINGEPLPEAPESEGGYLSRPDLNDFGPVTVLPDHYFMMGDNRPNSSDSRFGLGQISRDQLLGRAFVIIWPFDSAGSLEIATYDQ